MGRSPVNETAALGLLVESIEAEAWQDLFAAAPGSLGRQLGLMADRCGAAVVLRAPGVDHLLFNRAWGIGSDQPATLSMVHSVVGRFDAQSVRRYFVHLRSDAGPAQLRPWLEGTGLAPYPRRWAKFVRDAGTMPETGASSADGRRPRRDAQGELTVRSAHGASDAQAFARLIAAGLDVPGHAEPILAALVGRPRWSVSLACADGQPVAGAALFMARNAGYLAMAATSPGWRRRGAQAALIARRLEQAASAGCRWVFSETGEAVAGEPNHSFDNLLRAGFRTFEWRENWAPVGTRWLPADAPDSRHARVTLPRVG